MVAVAQLVEPRFVVPVVAGSSPVYHPIFFLTALILQSRRCYILSFSSRPKVSNPAGKRLANKAEF